MADFKCMEIDGIDVRMDGRTGIRVDGIQQSSFITGDTYRIFYTHHKTERTLQPLRVYKH